MGITNVERINQPPLINSNNELQKIDCNSFGTILHVGGSGYNNYTKIQYAINAATDGSTIFVWDDSSPYYENIVIDKKINLIGENKETTIIDGSGNGDVICVSANGVNISSFTIQNSGNDYINAGIKLNSDDNAITNNIITNNEEGIYSYDLDDSIISENAITNNNDNGICIPFSSNNIVSSNTITDNNNYGIYLYDSELNHIDHNRISNSEYGIHLWHSFNIELYENTITNNCNGIQLYHRSRYNIISRNNISNNKNFGVNLSTSLDNEIHENTVENSKYGICLIDSSYNEIHGKNNVRNNEYGIYLSSSPNNNISMVNIRNNEYGIYLNHSSNNNINMNDIADNHQLGLYICFVSNSNIISHNNFIANHVQAYFKHSFFNNWKQNYWDNWDGIGPQPIDGEIFFLDGLIIVKGWLNFDLRPAKQPYER
jgi:parallel beta-helix repeat protein